MAGAGDAGRRVHTFSHCPGNILVGKQHIGIPHNPHRGPAVLQHALQCRQAQQRFVGGGGGEMGILIVIAVNQWVLMAIDQTGHQGQARKRQALDIGGQVRNGHHADDVFTVNDHRQPGLQLFANAVDQGIGNQRPGGRGGIVGQQHSDHHHQYLA